MEQTQLPQFYQKPVAMNKDDHGALTISPSPKGFSFAASAQTILLASAEFFEACRDYPIVFVATPGGTVLPVALTGLEQGENLFVDADGAWQEGYIPAYVRRYPFITNDDAEQMIVAVDEAFDGFNQEGGIPLFENGEPSAKMEENLKFMQEYHQQMQQTGTLGAMLVQAGLLRQIDAQANLADGRSYALNGMLVVDEQKLVQLPDIELVKLFRTGIMALLHAHLLSLRTISGLIQRKASRGIVA